MSRRTRRGVVVLAIAIVALTLAGCGSGSRRSGTRGETVAAPTAAVQNTVSVVEASYPDSLDPQVGSSSESLEATWVVYTGLVSYAHADGAAGATLIPGLATALPRVSDSGRTYTVTLRRGLRFSDGAPVLASDFAFTVERALALPDELDPVAPPLSAAVEGAGPFLRGRVRTITGVTADDRSGRIVIHLRAPDPDFDALLADPALGIIPTGSEPLDESRPQLPPGCGPYVLEHVSFGRSYELVRNPRWHPLPGIPDAKVNIDVRAWPGLSADIDAVVNNTDDLLDPGDGVPAGMVSQLRSLAPGRFGFVGPAAVTDYVFLNQFQPPFRSQLAREAVVVALDHSRLDQLADGELSPGCFLAPPLSGGHPRNVSCPLQPLGSGNLADARQDVRLAGVLGASVAVESPTEQPAESLMREYTTLLDEIGFHARLHLIPTEDYAFYVGLQGKVQPPTGFATLGEPLPGSDEGSGADLLRQYVEALDGNDITPEFNTNLGAVDDPHLDQLLARLQRAPTVSQQSADWQRVDEYVADRADVAVLGYESPPYLASERLDWGALDMNPIYGWDFTSVRLRS